MKEKLDRYKEEMESELDQVLQWWMEYSIDEKNGGFEGKIDHENKAVPGAPKGSVLNSRILWAFSSAYTLSGKKAYLAVATRAFDYIVDHFIDNKYGGVYWTVDHLGNPLDTKKQIYAQAFAVYGLSAYYTASKDERAKDKAIAIYDDILSHSYDATFDGYIEALTMEWNEITDLRLSQKDANEKKSMNTHLHLLEAFAALYGIWKEKELRRHVAELIGIFLDRIIDEKTNHLILFFDEGWHPRSTIISYGHDIEASWLIQEGAEMIGDIVLLDKVKQRSVLVAEAAAEGLDSDGGLWYEFDTGTRELIRQKHSWPQAEAMIGFFNCWQLTAEEKFLTRSQRSWNFVQDHIKDRNLGEWYWGVFADNAPMSEEDKAGIWKCPYHNSRACIEIINRIDFILKDKK